MPKTINMKKVFFQTLLTAIVVTALFVLPQIMVPTTFAAASYSLSASPIRIQEGLDTNITLNIAGGNINKTYFFNVTVTSSINKTFLSTINVTTDSVGSGSNKTSFWKNFPSTANTNYTGTYKIAVNNTLAKANFTVGLTDKEKYLRSETVKILGAGYNASEPVIVDLRYANVSVAGFPHSINADPGGVVSDSWSIPANAALGNYTVSMKSNATNGTQKNPSDTQTFTVEGVCEIQTVNLAGQPVSDITVKVYNATSDTFLRMQQDSNETGWVKFLLAGGNYTFKAFTSLNVEVGAITRFISESIAFPFKINLSNLKLTVRDESDALIPWIDLNVSYSYTTSKPETIPTFKLLATNLSGFAVLENTFAGIDYVISARRYGFLFNTTTIPSLPETSDGWNNITIKVPTYSLKVQVLDSQDVRAAGLKVNVYEWSSGTTQTVRPTATTDSNGNFTFSLPLGKYLLKLYKDATFLNEVEVDLIDNPKYLVVRSDVYNVDLQVFTMDYLGQPLPNVSIEFRRKTGSNYEIVGNQTTGTDGVARFNGVIGGDSQIVALLAGKQSETQYLFLVGPEAEVVFKMDAYLSILGFAVETSQFVTIILMIILVISFILALTYKKLPHLLRRPKK